MDVVAEKCTQCDGSGWRIVEGTFESKPCTCQRALRLGQRMEAASIPRRYVHCTLEGFYPRGNATLQRALSMTREFVDLWPNSDRGLLFMGGCGTGKTHLAVAALTEIIRTDKPGKVIFRNFQDLIQDIMASFESDDVPTKSELLAPILQAELLVLDELGSQKPTNFVQDTLYYVINTRYNENLATIFTSNYLDETQREEALADRIGARLRSRLWEMTTPVVVQGDDYRKSRSRTI